MSSYAIVPVGYSELYHHGVKGQKWGVRRYQDFDGKRFNAGKEHRRKTEGTGKIEQLKAKMKSASETRKAKREVKQEERQNKKIEKLIASGDAAQIQKHISKMTVDQMREANTRITEANKIRNANLQQIENGKKAIESMIRLADTGIKTGVNAYESFKRIKDASEKKAKEAKEAAEKKQKEKAQEARQAKIASLADEFEMEKARKEGLMRTKEDFLLLQNARNAHQANKKVMEEHFKEISDRNKQWAQKQKEAEKYKPIVSNVLNHKDFYEMKVDSAKLDGRTKAGKTVNAEIMNNPDIFRANVNTIYDFSDLWKHLK